MNLLMIEWMLYIMLREVDMIVKHANNWRDFPAFKNDITVPLYRMNADELREYNKGIPNVLKSFTPCFDFEQDLYSIATKIVKSALKTAQVGNIPRTKEDAEKSKKDEWLLSGGTESVRQLNIQVGGSLIKKYQNMLRLKTSKVKEPTLMSEDAYNDKMVKQIVRYQNTIVTRKYNEQTSKELKLYKEAQDAYIDGQSNDYDNLVNSVIKSLYEAMLDGVSDINNLVAVGYKAANRVINGEKSNVGVRVRTKYDENGNILAKNEYRYILYPHLYIDKFKDQTGDDEEETTFDIEDQTAKFEKQIFDSDLLNRFLALFDIRTRNIIIKYAQGFTNESIAKYMNKKYGGNDKGVKYNSNSVAQVIYRVRHSYRLDEEGNIIKIDRDSNKDWMERKHKMAFLLHEYAPTYNKKKGAWIYPADYKWLDNFTKGNENYKPYVKPVCTISYKTETPRVPESSPLKYCPYVIKDIEPEYTDVKTTYKNFAMYLQELQLRSMYSTNTMTYRFEYEIVKLLYKWGWKVFKYKEFGRNYKMLYNRLTKFLYLAKKFDETTISEFMWYFWNEL